MNDLLDLDLDEPAAAGSVTVRGVLLNGSAKKPIEANPAVAKPVRQRGPTKKAVAEYRAAVLAAVESGSPIAKELVFAAYKTAEICKLDFKTYRRRLDAKHALDVIVPALEAKAAEAERIARETKPWAERTLTGRQWEVLHASGVMLTPPPEHQAARQARSGVQEARQAEMQLLRETADPEIFRQAGELEQTRGSIVGTMNQRQKTILNIDGRITRQRAIVDAIIRGDSLATIPGIGPVHKTRKEENAKARRELDRLLDLSQQKPQAEQDQARDAARLAEIASEIGRLEQLKFDPRRMKWA